MSEGESSLRIDTFRVAGARHAIRFAVLLIPLGGFLFFAYGLAPLMDATLLVRDARASSSYQRFRDDLLAQVSSRGEKRAGLYEHYVSPLVSVRIEAVAFGGEERPAIVEEAARIHVEYGRSILSLGLAVVIALTLSTLLPQLSAIRVAPARIRLRDAVKAEAEEVATELPAQTPEELFQFEVEAAEHRADQLFSRSNLLLGGGIIMSFIGVTIFYITLPINAPDESIQSYLPKAIRPTGVLIFLQTISWFLLRQYRALIEDYKWFHRIHVKRSNYLAAFKTLNRQNVRPEDVFLAAALVNEDTSGRLAKRETTESLEAVRAIDENPLASILASFERIWKNAPRSGGSGGA